MPDIFLADGAAASSVDRGHSLRSLLPPPAALPSLPLSGFTATEDRDGNLYRCIVTDGSGNTVTSNEVKLNTTDFAIYRQPSNAWGILGDTVSFSVRTYSTTSVTYQWQYSSDGGENWINSPADGNNTNTLTGLVINETRLGLLYRCVVTDGNDTVLTSNTAKIRLKTDTWQHTYDANGMRTKRANGDKTYEYVYNGGSLSQMTVGDDVLTFGYDASGKPIYVQWNGSRFFYVTNIQGDVVAIVSENGLKAVEYSYDAWGNILMVDGYRAENLGKLNPLRYRGYVYDTETGLYYLQSRYYNPEMGRFVNADDVGYLGIGINLSSFNLFAYCGNNPVNMADNAGNWPKLLSGVLNVVSGIAQGALGAAIGATVGWTGIGAVAAAALVANGAATVSQGIGQIYNDLSNTNTFREDNILRTGAQSIGYAIGGDTGATVAGMAYDTAILAATLYNPSPSMSSSTPSSPRHTTGMQSPKKVSNPGGSHTQMGSNNSIYSYAQYDSLGRQTMRIDFQGKAHFGVLPHIHLFSYPDRGGCVEYIFDLTWRLIN